MNNKLSAQVHYQVNWDSKSKQKRQNWRARAPGRLFGEIFQFY